LHTVDLFLVLSSLECDQHFDGEVLEFGLVAILVDVEQVEYAAQSAILESVAVDAGPIGDQVVGLVVDQAAGVSVLVELHVYQEA